jgi:hypothetical protein
VPELHLSVDVNAAPDDVWAAAVDWERQHRWMVGTTVTGGRGLGERIVATTRLGPLSFDDPMQITVWDPPRRMVTVHHGRVIRGSGAFEVVALPDSRSRFEWTEWLLLPFGRLGELVWPLVRLLLLPPLRLSLNRFARFAASDR